MEIKIENYELIASEMDAQRKGTVVLSKKLGFSVTTLTNLRKGRRDLMLSTLSAVCQELGLKIIIEKDETADVEPHIVKRGGRRSGVFVEPRKKKIPVPMKKDK